MPVSFGPQNYLVSKVPPLERSSKPVIEQEQLQCQFLCMNDLPSAFCEMPYDIFLCSPYNLPFSAAWLVSYILAK